MTMRTAAVAGNGTKSTLDQRLLLMHQAMLGDATRLQAYDRALQLNLKPGDVVVDVGSGLLPLSLMALRLGARRVYAVEGDSQTVALAQQIVRQNNLQERITVIQEDARTVRLPEKSDVLVSEMMGNLGPEEEMAEIILPMAKRNLRITGRVIPSRLTTQLQALQFDHEGWGVWSDNFAGYSLLTVQEYAPAVPQVHFFTRPPRLLSAPVVAAASELGLDARQLQGKHTLEINAPGCLHAVVGYFHATLAPDVTLSNFPSYPGCNWAAWIWPVRHTDVSPGDAVHVMIQRSQQTRRLTDWRLECRIVRSMGR
jgi:enediyne biosynthesis protein CalE3